MFAFRDVCDRLPDCQCYRVVKEGIKSAYCLEDSRRALNGSTINCQRKYDCGMQGSQRGWLDSYGWSLDCSWMDVTDVPAGEYILVVEVSPTCH